MYNRYHISSGVCCCFPPRHSELCDIFSTFVFLIVLKRRRTFPCTRKYFSVFLTSRWKQIKLHVGPKIKIKSCVLKATRVWAPHWFYIRPSNRSDFSVKSFFLFHFLLQTFFDVIPVCLFFCFLFFFNCMSKKKKGVCLSTAHFSHFIFIFSSC